MEPELPNENNSQANDTEEVTHASPKESIKIRHPFKIFLIVFAIIVIGIPIFLVSAFYIEAYFKAQEIKKQTEAAPSKISDARKSSEKKYDEEIKQMDGIITQSGVASSQIASSKVDVCYVEPQYTGLFIDFYTQKCYLRYVQGYTTNLTKAEVKKKILQQENVENIFYKEDKTPRNIYPKSCLLYEKEGEGEGFIFYIPAESAGKDESCNVPSPIKKYDTDNISRDQTASIKAFRTYSPDTIVTGTNQIWFYFSINYYSEKLGCIPGKVTCENPRPNAIQAPY